MRTLGEVTPTREQQRDIAFGLPLLRELVALESGRALAVRERDVLCVAGAESVAEAVERAAGLCRWKGWTLIVARPALPLEVAAIRTLAGARAGCVAVATGSDGVAGGTPDGAVIRAADRARIAVVAIADEP